MPYEWKNHASLRDLAWTVFVAGLTVSICLPFTRTMLWLADEGIWLSGAVRLLHGGRLYADFFEIHPPGGFLITVGWFSLFGESITAARLLAITTIAGIAIFTNVACRKVSRQRPLAACFAIAWIVMTQGFGTQVNHHFFTTFLSMLAFCWALPKPNEPASRRGLVGGFLLAGAATMITPTRGILLAAALAIVAPDPRRDIRTAGLCALAFVAAPLAVLAYLASQHVLGAAFSDMLVFPATRYSAIQTASFGAAASLQNAPLMLVYPAAALFALLRIHREGLALIGCARWRLCFGFAMAGFIGSYPRPDIFHIGFTATMGLPLLIDGAIALTRPWSRRTVYGVTLLALAACVPCVVAFAHFAAQTRTWIKVPTARGKVLFPAGDQDRARLVISISELPQSDRVIFYPYLMMLPYLTGHDQASRNDVFVPGYTTPDQYRETCFDAVRHADWVVVHKPWMNSGYLKQIFPALQDANPPERRGLERAIEKNFRLVQNGAEFAVRRRASVANDTDCNFLPSR